MSNITMLEDENEYFRQGLELYNLGKYVEAIKCFDKCIQINSRNIKALNNIGTALVAMGRYEEAIKYYNFCLTVNPIYIDALYNKANTLGHLEKYLDAIVIYDQCLEIESKNINVLFNKAIALSILGKHKSVVDCLNKLLSIDPTNTRALSNKANALIKLEKYIEAIECYDKLLNIEPNNIDVLFYKGSSYYSLEKYSKAIECFDKCLKIDSKDKLSLKKKGDILGIIGKIEDSIDCYNIYLDIDSNDLDVLFNKGNMLMQMCKFPEAIECFNKTLEIKSDYIDSLINKGSALCELQEYSVAIDCFRNAIEIDPRNMIAFCNIGNVFAILKKYPEAISYYDRYLAINSEDKIIQYYKGIVLSHQKLFKEAADCFIKSEKNVLIIINELGFVKESEAIADILLDDPNSDDNKFFYKIIEKDTVNAISYKEIYLKSLQILSSLYVNKNEESLVAHYTCRTVAEDLLLKKSIFRLNSISTANDIQEGMTLLKFLGIDEDLGSQSYQAFVGCFTFNHDNLNQFRLYGKENNEEATGVSIVLNKRFFDVTINHPFNIRSNKIITRDFSSDNSESFNKYPLFRCVYIDPSTKKIISIGHKEEDMFYRENPFNAEKEYTRYKQGVELKLFEVKKKLNELKSIVEFNVNLNKKIVGDLLINLRYVVKHVAFKAEQECRIVTVEDLENNVNIIENGNSGMYINYMDIQPIHLEKVYCGSKVKKYDLFKDRCRYKGFENIQKCDHPIN